MKNEKYMHIFLTIFVLIAGTITCSGCLENSESGNVAAVNNSTQISILEANGEVLSKIEKIEVFHFHATQQCYSCKTVGNYAKETIKTHFADELKSGKIIFEHINIDLPQNKETVLKYGATGSSLWIGVYEKDGTFFKEENTKVWYKIKNKPDYMTYLKDILEQKLMGH